MQQGDVDAFAELYRRHYSAVRRASARRLSDAHEADEVSQAAFVKAFERIDQCAGERGFGPWVHVIARSLCMDAFRARARVEPREEPLAGGRHHRPNEPEESLLSSERAAQVQEALASLPERQRRAVIARDWEGLRPGEIADRLGLSVGAVDSLLLRARRRLALSYRRLAGEGGGGAVTVPMRPAMAGLGVALALGSQSVLAATTAAAHAVQDTAGRAAGGVVSAVMAVALSIGGVPAPPGEPLLDPPPVATVTVVPTEPAPSPRPPRVAPVPEARPAERRPSASPVRPETDHQESPPVVVDAGAAEPTVAIAIAAATATDPPAPEPAATPASDRRRPPAPAPAPPAADPLPEVVDIGSPLPVVPEAPASTGTEGSAPSPPPVRRPAPTPPPVEVPPAPVVPDVAFPTLPPD